MITKIIKINEIDKIVNNLNRIDVLSIKKEFC